MSREYTLILRAILIILLCAACYKLYALKPEWRERVAYTVDYVDGRPPYKILFIGNSRTFYNDMPYMVRDIADSANAKYKVQATMHALPGRSLKQHWHNARVQKLLEQNWDHVVIQERSGGHATEARQKQFLTYGEKLIKKAKERSSKVSLFVGWNYTKALFNGDQEMADQYYAYIQEDHQKLAKEMNIGRINIGAAWRHQLQKNGRLRLDTDGNHPNIHGSYLSALSVYKAMPESSLYDITFIPGGISQEHAEEIIHSVDRH